ITLVGPLQLALQSLVILDDQQDGKFLFGHARFRCGCAASSAAAGRKMENSVPAPGAESTINRPPIAAISDRASKEPIPKPSGWVDAKGWNRRLRTNSPSMPQPLSVMVMLTSWPAGATRTVTGSSGGLASTGVL